VSLSPALGLGIASVAEYVDYATETPLEPERTMLAVNRALPEGLAITRLLPVDSWAPALQDVIRRARYRATSPGFAAEDLAQRVADFLGRDEFVVVRERRGERKDLDIRPLVAELAVAGDGALAFTLVLAPEGSPRPGEVIAALAGPAAAETAQITRLELLAESGGRFVSPLLPARTRLEE
jgi:radical SAM-linked protein